MVAGEKTRVTFAEYAAMPEKNLRVELIDGEIVTETIVDPSPDAHPKTLVQVERYLAKLLPTGNLSVNPTTLHFDDGNSFEPDLFWVSADSDRCFLEENGRYWHGSPDLVIEILSPSTASDDRGIKFDTYQKHGIREYWLVDPEAKFTEVYRHDGNKFERQGVFKAGKPFVSAVLGGATIDSGSWFGND